MALIPVRSPADINNCVYF